MPGAWGCAMGRIVVSASGSRNALSNSGLTAVVNFGVRVDGHVASIREIPALRVVVMASDLIPLFTNRFCEQLPSVNSCQGPNLPARG